MEHVYHWYPEWQSSRSATIDKIKEITEEAVEEVIQLLYTLSDDCEKGKPVGNKYPVPKPETREEAEMKLYERKKDYPEEDHEYLEQIHWEDFEWEQQRDGFLFETHRLMKKALTDHYLDDILELEADYLRELDSHVYYITAHPFVDECYQIMDGIVEDE
ncbi:MAG: hypothetical protein IH595_12680 [Bacteroidales bacterium]|nr:hypothetical protein [Bacteroidales bacterium]